MTNQELQLRRQQLQYNLVLLESIVRHYREAAGALKRSNIEKHNLQIKKARILEIKIGPEFKLWY